MPNDTSSLPGNATVPLRKATTRLRLRVLATSDLHMHLAAYDYHSDAPSLQKGLSLTASLIAQARHQVPGAILIDNGDFLQGNPLGDYVALTRHRPHPMIQAMAHLRYDAINLGNHEFSHGMETLCAALSDAPCPVLSANIRPLPECPLTWQVRPWTIIDRLLPDQTGQGHRLRIGLVGVLPPETAVWDKQAIAGQVQMAPMVQSVAACLGPLRAAGAEVIIVLAHCGIGHERDRREGEEGALQIAALDGVDAVVMGHVHSVFPSDDGAPPMPAGVDSAAGTLHGKPAVMPGFFGSHLGVIDLMLMQHPDGGWHVAGHQTAARSIAHRAADGGVRALVQPDPTLAALTAQVHDATCDWVRRPIGHTPRAIHSFFAQITDCRTLQIVNQAQTDHVAARLAGGMHGDLPVLSSTAPFRAGGLGGPDNYTFIPPGDLLLRHAADLYIHPNTIIALRMTGDQLRHWLECSVRGYHQIVPGLQDQPLLPVDPPSFLYDTICGVSYEIDLSQPGADKGGARIRNLCWQGRPVTSQDAFILATNSYRGSGSGGHAPVDPGAVVLAEQTANRDVLTSFITRRMSRSGPGLPVSEPAWRFRPMPGTSVLFNTSPKAADLLEDAAGLDLKPLGLTADGFLTLRLTL